MRNLFFLATLSVFGFLVTACNDDPEMCVNGSGQSDQYTETFDEFDEIELSGAIDLHVTQGATQSVVIESTSEIYSRLETSQNANRIEIGFKEETCIQNAFSVVVYITVPNLTEIAISGESTITSDELDLNALSMVSSGISNYSLKGQIQNQSFSSSGAISAANFDVISQNTTINVSGTGDFEVNCTDNLAIDVSGAATIKYKGDPTIDQKASGTLVVTKVE